RCCGSIIPLNLEDLRELELTHETVGILNSEELSAPRVHRSQKNLFDNYHIETHESIPYLTRDCFATLAMTKKGCANVFLMFSTCWSYIQFFDLINS
ncbi:MAG: hypothetical protein H6Q68_1626, partial [Firmicutes bacterium]|nr:hypothetical protein [Bacillota bacterium]